MPRITIIAAALAIAGGLSLAAPVSAAPVAIGALPQLDMPAVSNIELIAKRYYVKPRWSYNRARHGARYRYRHGRYVYKYGGWYYPNPWWYAPGVAIGIGAAYGAYGGYYDGDYGYAENGYGDEGYDAHVEWCLNRYRSYDPRSDTFLGYDGDRHRCNSPAY